MEKIEYKGSSFYTNEITQSSQRRLQLGAFVEIWFKRADDFDKDDWPTLTQALADAHLIKYSYELLSALKNILDYPQEDLVAWANGDKPVIVTLTPGQIKDGIAAIAKATNTTRS
jgi:hypothetical protein